MDAEHNTVLLQGFDRSGSTAISRLLATGTNVELFMQPFNSGPIRERMYEIWSKEMAGREDVFFFENLERGILLKEYIKSHWFEKHSTTTEFVPGHFHFIKTTINHFTTKWINDEFTGIDQWGIWREPIDILASILRNDFVSKWYEDAIVQITPALHKESILYSYLPKLSLLNSEAKKAAFLIAVRSHFLFYHIPDGQVIEYKEFVSNSEKALNTLVKRYGLVGIAYDQSKESQNLVGKEYAPDHDHIKQISEEDLQFAIDIFKPLKKLVKERHHVG